MERWCLLRPDGSIIVIGTKIECIMANGRMLIHGNFRFDKHSGIKDRYKLIQL